MTQLPLHRKNRNHQILSPLSFQLQTYTFSLLFKPSCSLYSFHQLFNIFKFIIFKFHLKEAHTGSTSHFLSGVPLISPFPNIPKDLPVLSVWNDSCLSHSDHSILVLALLLFLKSPVISLLNPTTESNSYLSVLIVFDVSELPFY